MSSPDSFRAFRIHSDGKSHAAAVETMAVDALSRPGTAAALRQAIDALFEDLQDPARYDPREFARHLQAAGAALP